MDIWKSIERWYYIKVKHLHEHKYSRIEDSKIVVQTLWGTIKTRYFPRYQCGDCKKVVGLDAWQIRTLPPDMRYEKLDEK